MPVMDMNFVKTKGMELSFLDFTFAAIQQCIFVYIERNKKQQNSCFARGLMSIMDMNFPKEAFQPVYQSKVRIWQNDCL